MMRDDEKTKEQLISDVKELRRRVADLESNDHGGESMAHSAIAQPGSKWESNRLQAILSAAIECLPFEFFAIGPDGRYLLQNAVSRKHFGNIIGKRPEEYDADGQTRQLWLDNNRRAWAGQRVEGEVESRIVGQTRRLHNIITPIRIDGDVYGILGVNIDITDLKRAEEALQKAHHDLERRVEKRTAELAKANEDLEIFRKFAEASGEGFGMSGFDGRIAYVNPTLCRLFGEDKPEDIIGRKTTSYYPEEYAEQRKLEMIPALLQDGYWHGELTALPRHGKPVPVLQSAFLIRDENGSPFRIAVVISDITERRQAEEALQREFRTLKHLLHSSDHERQLIAYEIHDGLAQQLAGALMQFQAFQHLKDKNPKEAAKAYEAGITMLQQGHFEARRLIAGVRPPILDESGVVEAVAHLVHEEGREQGPKIELHSRVDFDRLAPTLENAVYRIVQEALTNACRHSKSERVRVGLLQRGDRVRIDIRDWGVGFDPQTVQANRFGLEGIRQRARLLGGRCSIRNSPGKGTRITVELPVIAREPE